MLEHYKLLESQVIDDDDDPKSIKNRYNGEVHAGGMRNWIFHHMATKQGFGGKGNQAKWSEPTKAFIRGGFNFGEKPYPPLPQWFMDAWESPRQFDVDDVDAERLLDEMVRLYEEEHRNSTAVDGSDGDAGDGGVCSPKIKRTKI